MYILILLGNILKIIYNVISIYASKQKQTYPLKEIKKINFFVVYCKTKKSFEKYIKRNSIKGKIILDVKKILQEEEIDISDKTYLKIIIFNKIQQAVEKGKDIYYIPNFDDEFSIEKLLNLRKILGDNNFNILLFFDQFGKSPEILQEAFDNISKFSNSQIIKDY